MASSFYIASVDDYFSHAGMYMVRTEQGVSSPAIEISQSPLLPIGVRPMGGFPPKTQVMVLDIGTSVKYIVGAVQGSASDPRTILPDFLTLRSLSGFFQEEAHFQMYSDPTQGLGNYSAGRPGDTIAGDWGGINDLGVAVYIGRIIAALKASNAAKVEAFWGDDLLRLTGYNLETHTANSEHQEFNDEGESHDVYRATPFPWEGLGMGSPEAAAEKKDGKLEVDSEEAKYEPKQKDQMILARYHRFGGYLGDLRKTFISAPPKGLEMERYSLPSVHNGLLEITEGITGAYGIRSAKSIIFEKTSLIPVPKQLIQPDDPKGDNRDDYAAAGQVGTGDKPELKEFSWGDDADAGIRVAQLYDAHSWFFNRYTVPGLVAHKKDWKYPEESELKDLGDSTIYNRSLRQGHTFMLDLPAYEEFTIDDRPGHTAKYYKSRSIISQLDDGTVLIEDGYGSQIRMSGGNIDISAVNDIWLRPGRNLVAWAPHDAIIRAGNSADVSASKGDLRLKAEKNLHMLGGNAKEGGILLEDRSEGVNTADGFDAVGEKVQSHGIILKSAKSEIMALGKNIYLSRNQTDSGKIVIDAGDKGQLLSMGQTIESKAEQLNVMAVQTAADANAQMFALNSQGAALTVPIQVIGDMTILPGDTTYGNLLVGGNAVIYGGTMVKGGAVGSSDEVSKKNPAKNIAKDIRKITDQISDAIETQRETFRDDMQTSPGNDKFQEDIGFSCRDTEEDLKLDDTFIIYEARWQQILRIRGPLGVPWDEPVVKAPNGENTMPHPGYKGWQEWSAFATVELKNFDMSAGRSKDRASLTDVGGAAVKQTLLGNYPINTQT